MQVVLLANAIFLAGYARHFAGLVQRPGPWAAVAAIAGVELLWGFYQELVYRGVLQTGLPRRFGAAWDVLAANLAFTVGPLHWHHFPGPTSWAVTAAIFAATFAIGLFFVWIFHRTRNLRLVGVFHGIGNAWSNGAARIALVYPPVAAATS